MRVECTRIVKTPNYSGNSTSDLYHYPKLWRHMFVSCQLYNFYEAGAMHHNKEPATYTPHPLFIFSRPLSLPLAYGLHLLEKTMAALRAFCRLDYSPAALTHAFYISSVYVIVNTIGAHRRETAQFHGHLWASQFSAVLVFHVLALKNTPATCMQSSRPAKKRARAHCLGAP